MQLTSSPDTSLHNLRRGMLRQRKTRWKESRQKERIKMKKN
jgi:hypothetical protein